MLKDKEDSTNCILKVAPAGGMNKLMREHALLLKLHDSAFPHPITCFTRAGLAFLLREYIPGKSLADYLEGAMRVPMYTASGCCLAVCFIISISHVAV